jgi:hypothetical protein
MMVIGIKFCGLCNPEIDHRRLVGCITDKLGSNKDIELTYRLDRPLDALIIINGCRVGCIEKDRYKELAERSRIIRICGNSLDLYPVSEEKLCEGVIEKLTARRLIEVDYGRINTTGKAVGENCHFKDKPAKTA